MALQTLFSATPLSPWFNTYDPAKPGDLYVWGYIHTYGGLTGPEECSLIFFDEQYNNDEIIVGNHAVKLTNQDLWAEGVHPMHQSSIALLFSGHNVSTDNQYLLVFKLRGVLEAPTAQFFAGTDLVDTVELGEEIHQHAILLDCPGSGRWVSVFVRAAAEDEDRDAAMAFRGVDCYLL